MPYLSKYYTTRNATYNFLYRLPDYRYWRNLLNSRPRFSRLILLTCIFLSSACTPIGYYAQSISGQVNILVKQKPIAKVIKDDKTEPAVKLKLLTIEDILAFAHRDLGLPDNGSYRKYADLQRRYVVWNVFAAPELSLQAKDWCYLVVGCMGYRGYFNEESAKEYARGLQSAGWEIYVGGVAAYSTLGWFRDPVMNTMLQREPWELARLIFHELAHQRLYFPDDTDFNEAFADTVALIGLEMWLQTQPTSLKHSVNQQLEREGAFIELTLAARERLALMYESDLSIEDKHARKLSILETLRSDYYVLSNEWGAENHYDSWIEDLNNAGLSALSAYRRLVPELMLGYINNHSDMEAFYLWATELASCRKAQRAYQMRKSSESLSCKS